MDSLITVLKNMSATEVALVTVAFSVVLVYVFYKGWKRANVHRKGLQKELAQRGAWLADTKDKLYLEERNAEALSDALARANEAIASEEYKLRMAREKIASLNAESDALYESYLATRTELKTSGVALQYWQSFARRALEVSRHRLVQSSQLMKDALMSKNGATIADALELTECCIELIVLANCADLPQRIRDLRADGSREVIHFLPRLKRYAEERKMELGERFNAKIPDRQKPVLFAGSWMHLELVLATMFDNAIKHSVASSPIELEFVADDRMATIQLTNVSPTPVPDGVMRGVNEMMIGDGQRPRFGLYLLEQIANGYRAICKIENLGFSKDGAGHLVRTGFSFSLR